MSEHKLTKQQSRTIEFMLSRGSITALQARDELGIMQLSARIWELRQLGYPIKTQRVSVRNRFEEKTVIAVYTIGV